ncbi:MAG: ABC transporter substrate-binding protein [Candidatus Acetothermia bacterium]|jgi:multiple sugar transport system substrate-binding protein|nr:ABC transporter substrate-binding protein [Candidatus Acetothermia bacterium]
MRKGYALIVLMMVAGLVAWGGEVKITFWHAMGKAHAPALEALTQKFMAENPGIVVELIYQGGYGALEQKLYSAVAAGQPPTVAQQYENWTTQFLDALVPLEDYLSEALLADLVPALREGNTFPQTGKLMTVPFNKSIVVLYYRPDLVPTPPTTWEEFRELVIANAVDENRDGVFDRYGTAFRPPNPEIFLGFLAQTEGSILSPDWQEVTINDAKGLEAAEFVAELAKYALVQGGYTSDAIAKGISIAMFLDTSAGYPYNLSAANTAGVPLAVAPVPCHKTCASMIQGTNLGVFALNQTPEQIAAAAKYIEFLLRPENTAFWAQSTGYLPVTQSGIASPEWQAFCRDHPERAVMTSQFAHGFSQLLHPAYAGIRTTLISYYELLLTGQLSPKAAMDQLAAEIEALIAE